MLSVWMGSDIRSSWLIRLNSSFNRCPGAVWLLGAYIEAIWKDRDKEHVVNKAEFFGFLKFKFRINKSSDPESVTDIMFSGHTGAHALSKDSFGYFAFVIDDCLSFDMLS